MHASGKRRDDGQAQGARPKETVSAGKEPVHNLTHKSSSDDPKRKKAPQEKSGQNRSRPKWKDEPSAMDLAEGEEKLKRMKDRQNFLRNPRFLPLNTQKGGKSLIQDRAAGDRAPLFKPNPPVVMFTEYNVGHSYKTTLELINVTSLSHHVRIVPPTTRYFSVGLGRFPSKGGIVAPGMSVKYTVSFTPDSLGDYKDFIQVVMQAGSKLVVPIEARRPPPKLTLSRVLDCGFCLVGGEKRVEFPCRNVGLSTGSFDIIPKSQWPVSDLRSVVGTNFTEQPPFKVTPSMFVLQPGEATVVQVVFSPTIARKSHQVFTVVCDNCQVQDVSIKGESQVIALELVSVSGERGPPVLGEMRDNAAEHLVRFSPCNPHSVQHKSLVIRNNINLEMPFKWGIMKPDLDHLLPEETPKSAHVQSHPDTDDVFHISPLTGVLAPCQEQEFRISFCPKELKDYHSVCHLVVRDVPQLPPEPSEHSVSQPGPKVSDVTVMKGKVQGRTEPYQILLDPDAVVIPGDIFIHTTTCRLFKMWNYSKTFILFQWETFNRSGHVIEVKPSAGRIEEDSCFDFKLVVTGGKPEKIVTSLICNIQHHHKPITLPVEVSFKGPTVTVSVPSIDFGLLRLGEATHATFLLTNPTPLRAKWKLEQSLNSFQDHQDTQMTVKPSSGTLPRLASCSVEVFFRPRSCQQFETELELTVENGEGGHLRVRADVQSPQACLLNCRLVLSELYLGVPTTASVTLLNQTLLPSHFSWVGQLQGKQASLCTATFHPSSGILGPNESVDILVNFTSRTDLELTEVTALCEVEGMNSPLVLAIVASPSKKLSVTYSVPRVCPPLDDACPPPLVLHFGEDVILKKAVTKQLLITNQTAIPATFTIQAEYFTCHASKTDSKPQKRFSVSFRAKQEEAKAHEEFVSGLLAYGKGAAFHVNPDSGPLGPFQTQTVHVTAYTDMWGEYRDQLECKVGTLEPVLIPVQMTVKGCPLYFQITGPREDDQHQGPTIYFGTHISGGDTVSRALYIKNPTMFDIRVDWETYNIDQNDRKLVDVVVKCGDPFPLKDADGNEIQRRPLGLFDGDILSAGEEVNTPDSKGASASLQTVSDVEEENVISESDLAEEKTCLHPSAVKKNFVSVHIRPHVGNLSDEPYCITPRQTVIPRKSTATFHASFTPVTLSGTACESTCVGLALGFMSLDSQARAYVPGKVRRVQGLDLEPIRLDLQAAVSPAVLLVQMEEDDGVLQFTASAGDLLKGESDKEVSVCEFDVKQRCQLKNPLKMPLRFRLETKPPFSVFKSQPRAQTSISSSTATDDSYPLLLQPEEWIEVKVAFHCSLPLLDTVDQQGEELLPTAMLIHSKSGQKKLRFEQNLQITFSNNTQQTVPLRAHLYLPTLSLSCNSLSFGVCYVGQTQTKDVNLNIAGGHIYWKSLIESGEGESDVFRVTPDFGLLKSNKPYATVCSQSLQLSFTPSEDREFKAVMVITSPLVKTPITLQLQGTGSG
ncbi:deleted in lung and esophageal cancer protein 1-like [Cololabis saira]|uniref:deleted in lung and esophageal cancer protein 1-like n=1 Tax=Cololabis saira TaxID=129043 RepID=UPI002AD5070F|nr:deleted in lung and esophageal cancer protein 1-like [Cololabis saira]